LLRFSYSDKIGNHIICFVPYRNKTPFTLYSQELRFIIIQSIDVINLRKTFPSLRIALINCITGLVSCAKRNLIDVVLGHAVVELDAGLASDYLQFDFSLIHGEYGTDTTHDELAVTEQFAVIVFGDVLLDLQSRDILKYDTVLQDIHGEGDVIGVLTIIGDILVCVCHLDG